MLLVIFGAGASYDSAPHIQPPSSPVPAQRPVPFPYPARENDRPPLANQLFDTRDLFAKTMGMFKDCMPLVPSLRKEGVSVEKELAKVKKQAETYSPAHRELAAVRYYLHVALHECQNRWRSSHAGVTNYLPFLREIERWKRKFNEQVCLVTFNYDTMLEEAVSQVLKIELDSLDAYIAHPYFALVKPHGSVNWGRELDDIPSLLGDSPQGVIDRAAKLNISDRYRIVSNYPMWMEGSCAVFPALAIPVEGKDEFSCPETHVERLRALLPSVTKIITVGWRATEADFLDMLKLTKGPDLMIVSGDVAGADETYANLGRAMGRPSRRSIETGFSGLIGHLDQLEDFLWKLLQ